MFKIYFSCCQFKPTTFSVTCWIKLMASSTTASGGRWHVWVTERRVILFEARNLCTIWSFDLDVFLVRNSAESWLALTTTRRVEIMMPCSLICKNHVNKLSSSGFKKETLPLWTEQHPAVAWQLNCALIALHFWAWIGWISRDRQIPCSVLPFLWRSSISSRISTFSRFVLLRQRHCPTRRGMRTSKQWQVLKEQGQDSKSGTKNETRKEVTFKRDALLLQYEWPLFSLQTIRHLIGCTDFW